MVVEAETKAGEEPELEPWDEGGVASAQGTGTVTIAPSTIDNIEQRSSVTVAEIDPIATVASLIKLSISLSRTTLPSVEAIACTIESTKPGLAVPTIAASVDASSDKGAPVGSGNPARSGARSVGMGKSMVDDGKTMLIIRDSV